MPDKTYGKIELTGSSPISSDDAIQNAITKAAAIVENIHWFEMVESRGYVQDNKVAYWQVTVKIGYRMD